MATGTEQIKKDYFWNTLGSLMNSLSSVLLLVVVTRLMGTYMAGVFSLAYAVGQQFQVLGQFEMRPYQATDVSGRFSFGTYFGSRLVTCGAMVVALLLYAVYSNGLSYDALLLLLIALLKVFDVFEDVFHGMFQQRGRLDMAGKAFFFRSLTMTVTFIAVAWVTQDLLSACLVAMGCSVVVVFYMDWLPAKNFERLDADFSLRPLTRLLLTCLPLFVSSFLSNDLVNVPRYGIEDILTKDAQTVYAILYMPALVINMLVGFLFKPLLTDLAEKWTAGERGAFASVVVKGVAAIAVTTVLAFAVAWPLGIPVLSWLYGVDLSAYHTELMVVLVGGAFNALSVILYYALITMRLQRLVVVGYAIAAGAAHLLAGWAIGAGGIMGAVLLYDGSMALLALLFACFVMGYRALVRSKGK